MNNELINDKLYPKAVVFLYGRKGSYYSGSSIITRKVLQTKDGPVIGPEHGTPDTIMRSIAEHYFSDKKRVFLKGPIPENLIYISQEPMYELLIWNQKPKLQEVTVKAGLIVPKKHKLTIPLPGLVMMVKNETLHIYAYTDKILKPTSKLYHAPLFNVHEDGELCHGTGNFGKPYGTFTHEIERYTNGLFLSEQNTLHNPGTKTSLPKLYAKLIKAGSKLFPITELKKQSSQYATLQDLY